VHGFRSPIAWRLTLWFLLLSIIPIAVMAVFVRHTVADSFVTIARHYAETEAQVISIALSNMPRDEFLDTLDMAVADRGDGVAVIDEDGYLLNVLSGGRMRGPEPYPKELIALALTNEPGSWVDEATGAIFGYAPIAYRDHYVIVAQNPDVVDTPIGQIERSSFLQLAVSLAIVAVAGGAVIWLIIGPIQQLNAAAEEIGRGNLDVRVDTEDMEGELRVLTDAFNDMARKLRASYSELELQVQARTLELETINRIASAVGGSLDRSAMLSESLRTLLARLDYEVGAVCLFNDATGTLELAESAGLEAPNACVDPWASLATQAADLVEPVVILAREDGDALARAAAAAGLEVVAVVPMRAAGRSEGVLIAAGGHAAAAEGSELELLTSIGHHIGVGVQNARLHEQSQQLVLLEERQRLARDLHDSVTQQLYGVLLYAEAAARKLESGAQGDGVHLLRQARETAEEALQEMRLLIYELRPPELVDKGIAGALQSRLESVEGRAGIAYSLHVDDDLALSPEVEEELYRIAQEALNNALKHAHATAVGIVLRRSRSPERVELEVVDDGVGMDVNEASGRGGLGLTSMVERAQAVGGRLTVESRPGEGTRILVEVPL